MIPGAPCDPTAEVCEEASATSANVDAVSVNNDSTTPVVAGDDLPLSAYVYSKCEPSLITTCGDIEVTLSFTTILATRRWEFHAPTGFTDVHTGNVNNDNCPACLGEPGGHFGVLNKNFTKFSGNQKARGFAGAICHYLCLGGSSGYSDNVKVTLNAQNTTKCAEYRYYDPTQTSVGKAEQYFIDAGDPGPATTSTGVPEGCSP
jgi:hypothetical protein